MPVDKSLRIALLISALFHLSIFLPSWRLRVPIENRPEPSLNITYLISRQTVVKKEPNKKSTVVNVPVKPKQEEIGLAKPETKETKKTTEIKSGPANKKTPEPASVKTEQKAEIVIPPELPKEQEALYLDYYQTIRQRIRQFVVQNYPRYIARGDVCLYFVLLPDGRIEQIKIIQERSCKHQHLQEIAERSVVQAAPFIAFPKELNQPQLSFNVVISFEVEE